MRKIQAPCGSVYFHFTPSFFLSGHYAEIIVVLAPPALTPGSQWGARLQREVGKSCVDDWSLKEWSDPPVRENWVKPKGVCSEIKLRPIKTSGLMTQFGVPARLQIWFMSRLYTRGPPLLSFSVTLLKTTDQ